jgi:hypothetical protein
MMTPGAKVIELSMAVIYNGCLKKARVFAPGMPLQPSLMLVGKVSNLPKSRAPERYFTEVGSSLPHKLRLV